MIKYKKRFFTAVFIIITILVDYFLIHNFNTLLWPYLWPRPGIFFLVGLFALGIWLPEIFSGAWALRVVGLAMVFIGQSYFLHSFDMLVKHFSLIALIHFVGISGTLFVMFISFINQSIPKNNKKAPSLPEELPYVGVVIPTYGEPLDILRNTIDSVKQLDYPTDRICFVISDDGHREEVRQLAVEEGIFYNAGPRKDAKAGNLNSSLVFLEHHFPKATLVLTQDADEIIDSSFLLKTVGYFNDPEIAFVQTPKDAYAPPGDPFGVRDRVFYDTIQPGRNGSGAAFSCGSGVVWRIDAVKSIGGYVTWNIVEDLTTSYMLHSAGYRSEYHNEILTIGLAPDDIPGLLKQRGTWATDTWRLFLFRNPITMPGLKLRQRLQYFELGLFYVTSSFFIPLLMLVPLLSLLTGDFVPIEGSALFPWIAVSFFYYTVLAKGYIEFFVRMWQYWIGHSVTYNRAFWIAIRSRSKKPSYKVTRKTRQAGFYGTQLWPQFIYLIVGVVAIVHAVFGMNHIDVGARVTNVAILGFFMFMTSGICAAAFYGVEVSFRPDKRIFRYVTKSIRAIRPSRGGAPAQVGTD